MTDPKTAYVSIYLKKDLSDQERANASGSIGKLSGVFRIAAVKENAQNPIVKAMYSAYVIDDEQLETTLAAIRDIPGVQSAARPTTYDLIL